jgi:tetratricopeptide (TPR) repeat protein
VTKRPSSQVPPPSSLPSGSANGPELIGRADELTALEAALSRVCETQKCEIVTVTGAPGIGKTRLVQDFVTRAQSAETSSGEPAAKARPVRVYIGSAREGGAAFGVFAQILRARFGITTEMDGDAQRAAVREHVAQVLEDRKVGDVCFFIGQLIELAFVSSPLVDAVMSDPAQVRLLRQVVLRRFLEADSREDPFRPEVYGGPLVLVFDDLHRAHDEALDLLQSLIAGVDAPILMVVVAGPELFVRRDEWRKVRGAAHTRIELGPLSEEDSAAVMERLLSSTCEPDACDELAAAASTLAGGNPALLEQMVRIFFDIGVITARGEGASGWDVHIDKLDRVRLPLTVQDAVNARIAALSGYERELLERAAAMGGLFWLGGLVAMWRTNAVAREIWSVTEASDVDRIHTALRDLRDRDYILRLPDSTFAGDEEYVFKHNLERETLQKLTPNADAQAFHHAVADWLAFQPQVDAHEESLGMLAKHRELAGLLVQAGTTYLAAGDLARAHYANGKAAEYYQKGLAHLSGGTPGSQADPKVRLDALHHYGDVLQLLGRNTEALAVFLEMRDRAYRIDARAKGGAAHSRIGRLHRENGRLDLAKKHLDAALALFEDARDERGIASTVDDIGKLHWLRGDYEKALEFTQRGLSMRRRLGDRRSIALSLNNLGLVYQDSGQFKLALDAFEQALRIRREIGDLVGVCMTLNNLGTVAQDQRDDGRALALFREALEVAKETGDKGRLALVLSNIGEAETRLGDLRPAIAHLSEASEIATELGDKMGLAEAQRGLGKAYIAAKDPKNARDHIEKAVALFREIQSKVQLGVALRSLGELRAMEGAPAELLEARGHLLQSIWIFEEIGNDVELARSARVYARVLTRAPEYQTDPKVVEEARDFEKRAETIFQKLKLSTMGLDADAFFGS